MNGVTKIQLICQINGKADSDVGLLLLRTLPYKHGCPTWGFRSQASSLWIQWHWVTTAGMLGLSVYTEPYSSGGGSSAGITSASGKSAVRPPSCLRASPRAGRALGGTLCIAIQSVTPHYEHVCKCTPETMARVQRANSLGPGDYAGPGNFHFPSVTHSVRRTINKNIIKTLKQKCW